MEQASNEVDDLPEVSLDEPQWSSLADYLDEYYRQLGSQGSGLKTYFEKFDDALEGLRGIVILGGEPGSGKTALALQIGFDTALNGRPVVIYSFEMPKAQLVTRLFQRSGRMLYKTMQSKLEDLLKLDRFPIAQQTIGKAANHILIRETKDFFTADADGAVNAVFNFTEQIRQLQRITEQYGAPPLVIIDSLHEIPVEAKYGRELKQKIDFIMLNLRNMCDQTGATFLLISHQSRSGQANGGLQSFLGSASIEYTVDMAITIAYPQPSGGGNGMPPVPAREEERHLIVAKNRYGPKPKAMIDFDGKHMDFTFIDMLV